MLPAVLGIKIHRLGLEMRGSVMRIPLIAGNWKMNGSSQQTKQLITGITHSLENDSAIEVAIFPPFVYLSLAHSLLQNKRIQLGAQNLYPGKQGAFTGEVSASMLKDIGCHYVLIGHSERRTLFSEDLSVIAQKFKAALEAELTPILCVGEARAEREASQTEMVVQSQIDSVLNVVGPTLWQQAVIAYEPVWAIGTGLTATPEQAQAVHHFIRKLIAQNNIALGASIRILYGGSMNAQNAAALLAMPDVDGGLVGGASLDAKQFVQICTAAQAGQLKTA